MTTQLRDLIASALYPTKAHDLPTVCERYGLAVGDGSEAFQSKTRYVLRRLARFTDEQAVLIAERVARDFPDDTLVAAVERLQKDGSLLSDLTRHNLLEALNPFSLAGKRNLLELVRKHWPSI